MCVVIAICDLISFSLLERHEGNAVGDFLSTLSDSLNAVKLHESQCTPCL